MITLAYAYLSSSPSNLSSLKLRLTKPPSTFSTSLSNLKPLNPCNKSASNQRRIGNGICRAELGNDAPLAIAIGACILSSLVFPAAGGGSDDEGDAVIDSTDTRLAVMSIISFIPYFNWLSWVFAWLDSGKRRYAVYAIVYLAPYLRSNLSLSPEESWLPIVSILLCIAHIQVEVSITNGDIQPFQIFGRASNQISSTKEGRDRFKGSQGPSEKVLEGLDAVLDVGGVYDPSHDRYDHHQKGFAEVFGHGFNTKLSSAGLVYKHFGKEIISKELQVDEGHPDVHRLFLAVYKSFMEGIDAIDNGINQYDTDQPPKYVNNTHLSSRVGRLNLDWTDPDQSTENENKAFEKAMALAGSEFLDSVRFHAKSWLPARSIVMECLAARHGIDPSGEIMVLTSFCPWKLHLFELETELKIDNLIKYVLYQDDRSKHWRVQAVAVSPDRFESRKPLPAQWRGLRDEELSKESGIPGCVFVHMSGFIGGNQTYEGALTMAKHALKL